MSDVEEPEIMRLSDEGESESLQGGHERVQPRWLKLLTLILIPPIALFWGYMVKTGEALGNETLMLSVFGVIGVIVLLQLFYIARGYWRMDI